MAAEFKLRGVDSLAAVADGAMLEAEVAGVDGAKVLLVRTAGAVHATSPNCTHYGAPLKNGVLTRDGRLTCPWHGACFKVATGDVEDAPALDPLAKFDVFERDGSVYVKGDEATLKANRGTLDISCTASGSEKVVVVGGGSGATGVIEQLRKSGFKGAVTVIAREPDALPYDRPKLSKGLMSDHSKVAWRSPAFYKAAGITFETGEVASIDFEAKTVATKAGSEFPYTKLVLASGGSPRSLPLPGLKAGELGNVFLLRELAHTKAITAALGDKSKRVVVIGSSFIGLEVANAVASQDAKHDVTVVGMDKVPVANVFGEELGAAFQALLAKNGVKFHMEAQIAHAEGADGSKGAVAAVVLKDGTRLPADVVIQGVGVAPATEYLQDGSGSKGAPPLEKDGSVRVDGSFAVAGLPGVYAVGDIATYPYRGAPVRIEHWNVAQNAGRAVAKHLSGKDVSAFTPVFWSALGAQLRYCGNTAQGYDAVHIDGDLAKPSFAAFFVKGDGVVAVASMGKDPVVARSAELLRAGSMPSAADIKASGSDAVLNAPV